MEQQLEEEFFAAVVAGSTTKSGRGTRRDGPPHHGEIVPRFLKDEDNNKNGKSTYLVDANGNAYEPYALSWRYLGMYADCDLTYAMREIDGLNRRRRRQRGRQLGGNNNNNKNGGGDDCSRKILWAAYYDPRYSGHSIGEYQYYDWKAHTWDESTCQTSRCAKLNCHENRNKFKLIGVFKETDGLADWAEQLFKHEGYCVWNDNDQDDGEDDSDYEFMQQRRQYWMGDCRQMSLSDSQGNTLYLDTMPLAGGNMTYGLYIDKACSQESTMTFSEYVIQYYSTYYYNSDRGTAAAAYWDSLFERWNGLMSAYKICQPCRSYSKEVTAQNGGNNKDNNGNNNGGGNNNNDGAGEQEQYGYNCYDDAGYTNCNQCYKFETKTDMEPATADDLARATLQGTILSIRVNGTHYGRGTYDSTELENLHGIIWVAEYVLLGVVLATFAIFLVWNFKGISARLKRFRRKRVAPAGLKEAVLAAPASIKEAVLTAPTSLKEMFAEKSGEVSRKGSDITDDTESTSSESGGGFFLERLWKQFQRDKDKENLQSTLAAKEENLARQQEQIDQLKFALDMEKSMRDMERSRLQEAIDKLKKKVSPTDGGAEDGNVIDMTGFAGRVYATLSQSFSSDGEAGRSIFRCGDGIMKTTSNSSKSSKSSKSSTK